MSEVSKLGFERRNNWVEKLVKSKLFWLIFVVANFSYPIYRSMNRELPAPLPKIAKVPTYTFTNEYKKPFGSNELKGRTYIANFIFTTCPSSCLRLSKEMEKIQKRVRGLGDKIALVSFTVDPETDTPDVLRRYSRVRMANPVIWKFLTGPKEDLKKVIVDGFNVKMGTKLPMKGLVDGEEVTLMDIAHSEKFVLVDGDGEIRGYYDADKTSIDQMMIDVGLLVNRMNTF